MSNQKVRVEYFPANKSWAFVDPANPTYRLEVEQALIDATLIRHGLVEGLVKSVYGVDMDKIQFLSSRTKHDLGITATHRLGRSGTLHRVRLNCDGTVEKVS